MAATALLLRFFTNFRNMRTRMPPLFAHSPKWLFYPCRTNDISIACNAYLISRGSWKPLSCWGPSPPSAAKVSLLLFFWLFVSVLPPRAKAFSPFQINNRKLRRLYIWTKAAWKGNEKSTSVSELPNKADVAFFFLSGRLSSSSESWDG